MKKKKNKLSPKQQEAISVAKKLVERTTNAQLSSSRVEMGDLGTDALELVSSTQKKLMRQYNARLVETGTYGKSRDEVLDHDTIDVSEWEFMDANNPGQEIMDTIKSWRDEFVALPNKEKILFFCPCFKNGVLKLSTNRLIYWDVIKIDIESNAVRLFLHDYKDDQDMWEPGVSGEIEIKAADESSAEIQAISHTCRMYEDIYTMLSPKNMGWNEFETKLWKTGCVEHGKRFTDMLAAMDKHPVSELGAIFMHNISLVNMALNKQKAKLRHEPNQEKNECVKHEAIPPGDNKPERKVRAISGLVVKSEKPPRRPTRQSVIKYSMESWSCRGHVRRLKSGRLVHVSPSVHHRKALAGSRQDPINTTIIFKE